MEQYCITVDTTIVVYFIIGYVIIRVAETILTFILEIRKEIRTNN